MKPTLENDVTECLNRLYRSFQDEYVENPKNGKVVAVSHSHLVCNGTKKVRVVTLPELYALENADNKEDIQQIRTFTTLLPANATFYIQHYPGVHDVFVIQHGGIPP